MLFSASTIAAIAGLASLTSAAPQHKRTSDPSSPWSVTGLETYSPSGRPGNSPYTQMNVTIHDPNTLDVASTPTGEAVFPPSTAKCNAEWEYPDTPYGKSYACDSDSEYSAWSMEVIETSRANPSPTENFDLKFTLVESETVLGTDYTRTFIAQPSFQVGVNMDGECGGSGACFWGLSDGAVDVQQTEESS